MSNYGGILIFGAHVHVTYQGMTTGQCESDGSPKLKNVSYKVCKGIPTGRHSQLLHETSDKDAALYAYMWEETKRRKWEEAERRKDK